MIRYMILVVAISASSAFAKDVVTPTGALDFDLVERGETFILRSSAYAITFPSKPTAQPLQFDAGADKARGMNATVATTTGEYGIVVRPIPKYWAIGTTQELDRVRDGMLNGAGAKLTSETAIRFAGVEGRRVVATATENGKPLYIVAELLWDREHRTVIALMTGETSVERSAVARKFVDSFAITKGARGPLDEAVPAEGVTIKTDVPGLEAVRKGATYLVQGGEVKVVFPSRPVFRSYPVAPLTLVGAVSIVDDMETFGLTLVSVPSDQAYDPEKGLDGTRDGLVKQFDNAKIKETKIKVAGLDGRRIDVTGTRYGVSSRGEIDLAWDAKRRTLLSAMAFTTSKELPPSARAFLSSLVIGHR